MVLTRAAVATTEAPRPHPRPADAPRRSTPPGALGIIRPLTGGAVSARVLLAVALGGALGALARYGVALALPPRPDGGLPWATLLVNVLGSLALGALAALAAAGRLGHAPLQALLATGFCGAFTTFSTFSLETVLLARGGFVAPALTYVALNLGLCLAGTAAAFALTLTLVTRP